MKFSNPEERSLWERVVVASVEVNWEKSSDAIAWADEIIVGYRERRGSDTSKKPYGFSAGNGKVDK